MSNTTTQEVEISNSFPCFSMVLLMDYSKQEPKFPLRLLVDKERNHVVVAEANGDFIDILFSFLTLPLGTIISLVSKNKPQEIGCINNLYRSVENLRNEVFWNNICKRMLLCPRNPCEAICQKLKLKVDDSEPTKYFMCGSCRRGSDWLLSTFDGASCSCGKLMEKEMKLYGEYSSEETHGDGVLVKRETLYLIYDDLEVLQNSPSNSVQQLLQLGYKNFHKLTEMTLNVGLKEILDLLKQALTSKSPLSDVFWANGEFKRMCTFSPKPSPLSDVFMGNGEFKRMCTFSPKPGQTNGSLIPKIIIKLKVTVKKSKKKILYAEADGDFVDFLFSFLTTPIGSILELLNDNFSLGCMDNLHKSMKDLKYSNSSWLTRPCSTLLPNPRVASQFGCQRQPIINLREEETPTYWYGTGVIKNNIGYSNVNGVISKNSSLLENSGAMKLFDPRSPEGGFVRRPSLFVVWDDLQVTPLANTSSILFLQKLNVSLDDLEEHVVTIGDTEALNLLGASLTSSKAALTEGLFHLLKKSKEEAKA